MPLPEDLDARLPIALVAQNAPSFRRTHCIRSVTEFCPIIRCRMVSGAFSGADREESNQYRLGTNSFR